MSDALIYLAKARPEAVGPYLTFLKESGKHLDPKTRALITVITKVATQTENGLRQYLPKALHAGATPLEVLDALLAAFPALGLTKIVWATDIILSMDIPEFRLENLGQKPKWRDVIAVSEIADGQVTYGHADGRDLFIYREADDFHVYDSRCPHQVTNIPHLALKGLELTCPKHHWAFDVKTGACIAKGKHPLTRFPHRVESGRLEARW